MVTNPVISRLILFLILSCWILESEERTTEREGSAQRSGGLSSKEIILIVFGCLVILLVFYHAYKFYQYVQEEVKNRALEEIEVVAK